jgi:hypothetical protein
MYSSVNVRTHCSPLRIQETIPDPQRRNGDTNERRDSQLSSPAEATSATLLRIDVSDDTRGRVQDADEVARMEPF